MKYLFYLLITFLFLIQIAFTEVIQIRKWNDFANAVYITKGIFITNYHCDSILSNFETIIIKENNQKLIKIKEMYYFNNRDIIVFVCDPKDIKSLKLKEEKYLGYPGVYTEIKIKSYWINPIITEIISQVDIIDKNILHILGPVYPGMSGSGVYFNKYLVGIVSKGTEKGDIYCEIINEEIISLIEEIKNVY